MYKPASSKSPLSFSSAMQSQRSAVGEIIRRAEKSIAGQEYKTAQELLAQAWRLDPGNAYIPAIVERVQILQGMVNEFAQQTNGSDVRYLAVSVGKEFPSGIKPDENADLVRGRIRRLMTVATTLFERGSYQSAYESVAKAEELDPHDLEVQALKQKVLPLYEASMTRRSAGTSAPVRRGDSGGVAASMAGRLLAEELKAQREALQEPQDSPLAFQDRLEVLRRQKESERRAYEQKVWTQTTQRRASSLEAPPTSRAQKGSFISTLLRTKRPG
jgi:tetratricopeptide (TPR) repeat protein